MMHFLASIALGTLAFIGGLFGAAGDVYGTAITTINGSDQVSASRTTINTNFTALLNGKVENATTSMASVTTLSSLASIGTITTGVWSGTAIVVSKGGTGSTTLSTGQLLIGNGTGNVSTVVGYGSSGQALISNGTGIPPTWQSTAFDATQNYTFTGSNTFSTSTHYVDNVGKFTATTSASLPLGTTVGGNAVGQPQFIATSTGGVTVGAASTATSTILSVSIPANALNTGYVTARVNFGATPNASQLQSSSGFFRICLSYGGTIISCRFSNGQTIATSNNNGAGYFLVNLYNNGATNSQRGDLFFQMLDQNNTGTPITDYGAGTSAVDSTVAQTLVITASFSVSNDNNQLLTDNGYVQVVR